MENTSVARTEYMQRNKIVTMTNEDERLFNAIVNLKKNYAKELENRKTSILIDHHEIFVAPVIKQNTTKIEKSDPKKTAVKCELLICQATKMNGEHCTAKAKPGCVFCGRHLPKDK